MAGRFLGRFLGRFQGLFMLILFAFLPSLVSAGELDNKIEGMPVASCENQMVMLTFKTIKPFTGRVYVKGMLDRPECSASFAQNYDKTEFSMMIHRGDCGMRQTREPNGNVVYSIVFVISHHGTFVTKADRAYRCVCHHREFKKVSEAINLSELGTTVVMNNVIDESEQPECRYSIHSSERDGPVISFAGIGDLIYHVWHCDSPEYGFLVHSCYVEDGRGQRFELLDQDGCAIDPVIQPEIMYDESMQLAHTETHGYKFSGTSTLQYRCLLEFCRKGTNECQRSIPPQCGRGKRSVRSSQAAIDKLTSMTSSTKNHDVIDNLIQFHTNHRNRQNVIGIEAEINVIDTLMEDQAMTHRFLDKVNLARVTDDVIDYCITSNGFVGVMLADCLFLVVLIIVSANFFRRRHLLKSLF